MTPSWCATFGASKFVSNWSFYLVSTFCSVSPQQKPGHAGVLCSGHFSLWWRHPDSSDSLKTLLPLPQHLSLLSDCLLLVFLSPWGHSSMSQSSLELSFSGSKVRVFTEYLEEMSGSRMRKTDIKWFILLVVVLIQGEGDGILWMNGTKSKSSCVQIMSLEVFFPLWM